jgi:ribonuclease HI
VSKEYEDDVREIHEMLQTVMEARLKLKEAAEDADMKRRVAAQAASVLESARESFDTLAEAFAEKVKQHPEAETLDVLAKKIRKTQNDIRRTREAHVGSSVQGQAGFHTEPARPD